MLQVTHKMMGASIQGKAANAPYRLPFLNYREDIEELKMSVLLRLG